MKSNLLHNFHLIFCHCNPCRQCINLKKYTIGAIKRTRTSSSYAWLVKGFVCNASLSAFVKISIIKAEATQTVPWAITSIAVVRTGITGKVHCVLEESINTSGCAAEVSAVAEERSITHCAVDWTEALKAGEQVPHRRIALEVAGHRAAPYSAELP